MMKRVAIIGLGIMGHGIADNFLKSDYEVTVWNRTPQKADDLVAAGVKLAATVEEAIRNAELVFEVTANDASSKEIWQGKGGIINNASKGQVLITCATLSVGWTDELAEKCKEKGLTFFDMPMTGGRAGAESGQLTLLVGGDKDKLESFSDSLKAIAKDVKYFGKVGSGMRYKLILNTVQAIHTAAFGEAMRLAATTGLDENLVGQALIERPGGVSTNIAWQAYLEEPEPITFSVEWIAKDLRYARDMAKSVRHPLLDDVLKIFEQAIEQGFSQYDWTKINKL